MNKVFLAASWQRAARCLLTPPSLRRRVSLTGRLCMIRHFHPMSHAYRRKYDLRPDIPVIYPGAIRRESEKRPKMSPRCVVDEDHDHWTGLSDTMQRRKIQNRINKRAERSRKKHGDATQGTVPQDSKVDEPVASPPTVFENGNYSVNLAIRPLSMALTHQIAATMVPFTPPQPPDRPESTRRRRWAPKSRTGCMTCRASADSTRVELLQRPYTPLLSLFANVAPHNKGLFRTLRTSLFNTLLELFDRDFWSEDSLQRAHSFPAIWHTGTAIAAECTSIATAEATTQDKEGLHVYAVVQHGQAIRSLITASDKQDLSYADKEAVLFSMVLLAGLSCLWKDGDAALIHIGRGIQLYRQWRIEDGAVTSTKRVQPIKSQSLITLFRRFEEQYFCPSDAVQLQAVSPDVSTQLFTSVMEAYYEFLPILIAIRCAEPVIKPGTERSGVALISKYREPFRCWKAKFARLKSGATTDSVVAGILTLEIWSDMAEIMIAVSEVNDDVRQLAYDAWLPVFERMVAAGELLHSMIIKNPSPSSLLPVFSLSLSVSSPLFFVSRCRDGMIRRKAIALLRKWPHQDGLVPSGMRAARAEQLMLFEERFAMVEEAQRPTFCQCIAGGFICGWHRVRWAGIKSTGSRSADTWLVTQWDWKQGYFKKGYIEKMNILW
ncbi:hypothetical protein NLG97_g2024 [Lecanicillium saksenae]|uniref:Uncharacterized protein n=1 Tax=Lecanicillium saksenae TaxID=468837 RepID=A0ACC1R4S3_9HYPO|nr:hypothetical protein NLG97_g2024 [Lecanicillium saksenae]